MSSWIRSATSGDLPAAISLLNAAKLPTEDLVSGYLAFVAEGDAGLLGVIGLESFGDVSLLRSLVVAPLARGDGIGRQLVATLESSALDQGARQLWLLTIDANAFFSELGFRVRAREDAPDAIRRSAEFTSLCPGDAILMSKSL